MYLIISGSASVIADTINASGALNYVWSPGGATSGSVSINPAATQTYTVTGIDGNGCKNTGTVKVVVINCITGIEQNVSNNDEVRVYPSPSNGKITIENIKDHQFSNADIYNVEGEKVYSFTPSAHTVIDLTTLPSGVYFLQLKGDKITITKKLVITK